MINRMKKILPLLILFCILFSGCLSLKQKAETEPLTEDICKYTYASISDIHIGDIAFNQDNSVSLALLPKVNAMLRRTSDSVAIEYTINLRINNLTGDSILLESFNYSLRYDSQLFDKGSIVDSLSIEPYQVLNYPLFIQTTLPKLIDISDDEEETLDIIKGALKLNNREVKESLELDSISYIIAGNRVLYSKN